MSLKISWLVVMTSFEQKWLFELSAVRYVTRLRLTKSGYTTAVGNLLGRLVKNWIRSVSAWVNGRYSRSKELLWRWYLWLECYYCWFSVSLAWHFSWKPCFMHKSSSRDCWASLFFFPPCWLVLLPDRYAVEVGIIQRCFGGVSLPLCSSTIQWQDD